jgi:prevent-host-death family protein
MTVIDRTVTTMTSREFNQDTAKAKRAALAGPVLITDRGRPSHVLITKAEFDRLDTLQGKRVKGKSLVEALAHPDSADIEFDVPEFKGVFKGFEFE